MAKKGLRSCLHCGIIQEDKQFKINGCRNECFDADEGKLRLELYDIILIIFPNIHVKQSKRYMKSSSKSSNF